MQSGKVYSIVFVGVNGVGKSTSLAKVCHYLKTNGCKVWRHAVRPASAALVSRARVRAQVMIAACDTFRAGAVEQLAVHARAIEVHLYEGGECSCMSRLGAAQHFSSGAQATGRCLRRLRRAPLRRR